MNNHAVEEQYIPKFVSKSVRAFCNSWQSKSNLQNPHLPNSLAEKESLSSKSQIHESNRSLNNPLGSFFEIDPKTDHDRMASAISSDLEYDSLATDFHAFHGDYIEESYGACAIIEFVGYKNLIVELSKRPDVSADMLSRSLESYISKIIDMIEGCHGDVAMVAHDRMIVFWKTHRSIELSLSDHEYRQENSAISKAALAATLCCVLIANFLSQSEIWALEDIAEEYAGLKLRCRCAVSIGSIYDAHLGIPGIRMDVLPLGKAVRNGFTCLDTSSEIIRIHHDAWDLVGNPCSENGLHGFCVFRAPYTGMLPPTGSIAELQELAAKVGESAVLPELLQDYNPKGGLIDSYIVDNCLNVLRTLRKQRKGFSALMGTWCEVATAFIHLRWTNPDPNWEEDKVVVQKAHRELQRRYQIVIKVARLYGINVGNLVCMDSSSFLLRCTMSSSDGQDIPNRESSCVKFAMTLRDSFFQLSSRTEWKLNIVLGTGKCYEGLILNKARSFFRQMGPTYFHVPSLVENLSVWEDIILCDYDTHRICSLVYPETFFVRTSDIFFEICPPVYPQDEKKTKSAGLLQLSPYLSPTQILAYKDELERIDEIVSLYMENGISRTILIEGPPGSGKTEMLRFITTILEHRRCNIVIAEGREGEYCGPSILAFSQIIEQLTNMLQQAEDHAARKRGFSKSVRPGQEPYIPISNSQESGRRSSKESPLTHPDQESLGFINHHGQYHQYRRKSSFVVPNDGQAAGDDHNHHHGNRRRQSHTETATGSGENTSSTQSDSQFGFLRGGAQKGQFALNRVLLKKHEPPQPVITVEPSAAVSSTLTSYPTDQTVIKLQKILQHAGEDLTKTLPLFNAFVLPDIPETPETERITAGGRTLLLGSLLNRLLVKLAKTYKIALVIDSVQWLDSVSWELLLRIVRKLPNILVVLAVRSRTVICNDFVTEICKIEQTECVSLHGWTRDDIQSQVLKMHGVRANTMSHYLLDKIQESSRNIPAVAEVFCRFLLDSNTIRINKGQVDWNIQFDMAGEQNVPSYGTTVMIWQFNRLRSKEFQRLLKCASVIGIVFTLEEVVGIWNSLSHSQNLSMTEFGPLPTTSRLAHLITAFDYFNILEKIPARHATCDPYDKFTQNYRFRHSLFRDTVYKECLVDDEKRLVHLRLVRFYEKLLVNETETIFIPRICHHYRQTRVTDRPSILKRIRYLVMLGNYYIKTAECYLEARTLYREVESIIEKNNLQDDLGPSLRSQWHVKLAYAYFHGVPTRANPQEGLRQLHLAINLLDFKWPSTDREWWKMVWKQSILWAFFRPKLNMKKLQNQPVTNGAVTKRCSWSWQSLFLQGRAVDRLLQFETVIELLSRHMLRTDARLRDQIATDLLCLNVSIRLGKSAMKAKSRLIRCLALKLWFAGYMWLATTVAETHESIADSIKEDEDPLVLGTTSSYLTATGRWEESRQWTKHGMRICKEIGDFHGWLVCSHHYVFMLIFDGRLEEAITMETQRGQESRLNGNVFGTLWSNTVLAQINILLGNLKPAMEARKQMEELYDQVGPQLQCQIQGVFAQLELAEGRFDSCLHAVEQVAEFMRKVHYSNNQIFYGVYMCIYALFTILEKNPFGRNRRGSHAWTTSSKTHRTSRHNSFILGRGFTQQLKVSMDRNPQLPAIADVSSGDIVHPIPEEIPSRKPTWLSTLRKGSTLGNGRVSPLAGVDLGENSSGRLSKASSRNIAEPLESLSAGMMPLERQESVKTTQTTTNHHSHPSNNSSGIIDRAQIRRVCQTILNNSLAFRGHAICEPTILLIKGLLKMVDSGLTISSMPGDTAAANLRNWAKSMYEGNVEGEPKDMQLLIATLSMKAFRVSGENFEYEPERNRAEAILTRLKLEPLLRLL